MAPAPTAGAKEVAVATDAGAPGVHAGGCHCGRVRWELTATWTPEDVTPRACDCDYCTRHGAAWVSDPHGALRIRARDGALLRYRQGSEQAQFLACSRCGVLVAVVAQDPAGRWLGTANRNAFDARARFAPPVAASPRQLAPDAKLARWTQLWTPVELEED
jgi:hypothetical protein